MRSVPLLFVLLLALPACAGDPPAGTIEFVESWPQHTELDLPGLRDAADVWPGLAAAAESRIDLSGFYFSRKGDGDDAYGPDSAPDHLVPFLDEVAAAAGRGVAVRTTADGKFMATYPTAPEWLGGLPGAEMRVFDVGAAWGGVLHAKYFLVDDDLFWVGSQNFDWRALGQIHELGVLVRDPGVAADARRIYELDWALAGGEAEADRPAPPVVPIAELPRHELATPHGDTVGAVVAASPRQGLPEGIPWDLPLLIEMIDAARDSVHLQLLSYGVTDREKRLFDDLDSALRRAAVRGAQVRIILSNWSKRSYSLPWIKSLQVIPGIEVKFSDIPEHPDGFIPFARVEHPKVMTVDGERCWIGTSNWSRGYFHDSRNVSLFLVGPGAARDADLFFNRSWNGPYTATVDPAAEYQPPRRN
jgi:phosphatidylserine/phosphatidylglycerophosphate/cardiolipin synthase-like enzyme